jgi:phage tail sheath protein FI
MFDWVGKTLVNTFWSRVDSPITPRLVGTILDTCNIWLNGLVGAGYLLGARAEFLESENPATSLMSGIIKFHIFITPPTAAQEIDFAIEYDVSYLSALFAA